MKTIIKITLVFLMIFTVSCGTLRPNIMIGPTGEAQKAYIENIKHY